MMKKLGWGLAGVTAAGLAYAFAPRKPRLTAGQVAVITGGSRGLGLAMAKEFGRAGLRLVLAARKQEELEKARQSLVESGDVADARDVLLVAADVTDPEQAAGLIDKALQRFERVDVLINNAAIIEVGPFGDQPIDAYYRAMQLTYFAALHTIHAVVPHMVSRGSGAIVNISSVGGKVPVPHLLPYVGAKFALTGFSEGLHAELRGEGVRVTTVCPGLMRSGGEAHAYFVGDRAKEEAWFMFSAKTPGIAVSVAYAARKIFRAVSAGRAEITISPQAWMAARIHGLMPETTQAVAALVNEYILPKGRHLAPPSARVEADEVDAQEEPFADPSPS
jgi:short-subunit dehydrogenase